MSAEEAGRGQLLPAIVDTESAYRQYIANTLLQYATDHDGVDNPEAYRRVMTVTGRTLGTVKNWLTYRTNLPDFASLARMVEHWKIPPAVIFPPQLHSLLSGVPLDLPAVSSAAAGAGKEHVLISLYGNGDPARVDAALSKYTDDPKRALLLRQEGGEMLDEIRPGELMLVDTGCEQIRGSGMYLLRFEAGGEKQTTHARFIDVLLAEPSVRIRGGSATSAGSVEQLPISDGTIRGVTVLGRIVGVLRQV